MKIQEKFEIYAVENYPKNHHFLEKCSLDASAHLNSVSGDKVDSIFSPLRMRFYSAVGESTGTIGAVGGIAYNAVQFLDGREPNPIAVTALLGATVLITTSHYIRHYTEAAIRSASFREQ